MTSTDFESLRRAHSAQPIAATMMQVPLRVTDIMRRAERLFADQVVVSRHTPQKTIQQTYAEIGENARKLAAALKANGIQPGMRVATLMWNHSAHLTAYYAVPAIDAVLHTLNPRLSAEEIAYIVADSGDVAIIVDDDLLPLWRQVEAFVQVPLVIVHRLSGNVVDLSAHSGNMNLDDVLASTKPLADWPSNPIDENTPVAICYTSGTTGRPKGVVYTHRSVVLHCLTVATPDALGISGRDCVFTLTPMFHVNAWSMPYSAVMMGAKQVYGGPRPSSIEIVDLISRERVTAALGVPTLWTDVLGVIEQDREAWTFAPNLRIYSGGSAPPAEMFRRFDKLGMYLQTGWGMTETSPLGSQTWIKPEYDGADEQAKIEIRTSNGIALPLVEMRHVNEAGEVLEWSSQSRGELQVRGPWVTGAYIGHPAPVNAMTKDGWFKTGDIVTIQANGYMRLVDRLKDLVKSGGEWISSIDMENALCDHPDVAEAGVIAVPDDHWGERPLAVVSLKAHATVTAEDIRQHLLRKFPKWMVPEHIEFMPALPKTGVGKLNKQALRKQYC